jgi:hypothetical protein
VVSERLPPVAAIREAMQRGPALRALAGYPRVPLDDDPEILVALMVRLRWPRNGAQRPWRWGMPMIGAYGAPWQGLGNVVRRWSASSLCTVWRKEPLPGHPGMQQWRSNVVDGRRIAAAIYLGLITDAHP